MAIASAIPEYIDTSHSLRVKIIDSCGMTCVFCHNEGTPVTADNIGRVPGAFTASGNSGRVSIYAPRNGAAFLAAPVLPGDDYLNAITALRDALDISELHLTGGCFRTRRVP